jgi:hypothetical protein
MYAPLLKTHEMPSRAVTRWVADNSIPENVNVSDIRFRVPAKSRGEKLGLTPENARHLTNDEYSEMFLYSP